MRYSYATVALPTLRPEEAALVLAELGYGFHALSGSPIGHRQIAGREAVSRVLCAAVRPRAGWRPAS